jgi:hypothetical protein
MVNSRQRRGATTLGCLFQLLIVAAVVYFGVPAFEVYWRYFQYRDAMRQEVRFRSDLPNDQLKVRLKIIADSLGLPEDAGLVTIRRENRVITVESHYEETIDLPLTQKEIHFEPRAVGIY